MVRSTRLCSLEISELEKPSTVKIEEWFEVQDYASLMGWPKFPQLRNDMERHCNIKLTSLTSNHSNNPANKLNNDTSTNQ
jgi:hypothetical protein